MIAEERHTETEEIRIETDVLVIGGGFTGVKAAAEIADLGYKVTLAEKDANVGTLREPRSLLGLDEEAYRGLQDTVYQVNKGGKVEVMTGTGLAGVEGVSGDFSVKLSAGDAVTERKFGSIVVANDFVASPLNGKYNLELSDTVLSQKQLEILLADNKAQLKDKTIAFLVGLGQEGNPVVMERVFQSVLAVQDQGCAVYVYTGDLKVAGDGLDRLYKEGRDQGASYFKLMEIPEVSPDGQQITFHDPVLRRDVEVTPDLVVVEEEILADEANAELAEMLRIDLGGAGFLQSDNVHFFPVRSNREGIFLAGASRDVQSLSIALADAGNVALEVANFLGDGTKIVPTDKAVVDPRKCVICLTCYRCCPHGAIYWEDNRAVISPVACQGCGICASECPQDAIQIGAFKDDAIKTQIGEALADPDGNPRIVAFCCENSAFEAGQMAEEFKMQLPAGFRKIKVPCAGKVDLDYIMTALADGADGVLVMACHTGNCKSERGNIYAGWRVEDAHRMMEEAGFDKSRLVFATIAANMGSEFVRIVTDMEKNINK
ncbi:MAG: hypothetical protein B6245_08615 [Desulfobacteraceae bacterium 4572_88]|nr:MAG: hypothetical protein B6245_08615 [Desulfobacteraceae bacterium 4572_88]